MVWPLNEQVRGLSAEHVEFTAGVKLNTPLLQDDTIGVQVDPNATVGEE